MATASVTNSFAPLTLAESSEVNTNFLDLVNFLNTQTMHRDASSAFTAVPSGPATNPTAANQLARKAYVDIPRYNGTASVPAAGSTGAAGNYATAGTWTTGMSNRITGTAAGCTIVETGWYWVQGLVSAFTITATHIGVAIFVNGVRNRSVDMPGSTAVNNTTPTYIVSGVINLTAGATVSCRYAVGSGPQAVGAELAVIGIQGTF